MLECETELEGGDRVVVGVASRDHSPLALLVLELDSDVGSTDSARFAVAGLQHVDGDALEDVAWKQHLGGTQVTMFGIAQSRHQHVPHVFHLLLVPVRQIVQETEFVLILDLFDHFTSL